MKRLMDFTMRIKGGTDKAFTKYTLVFLGLMLSLFFFYIFAGMAGSPDFTYADF